ncbi:DHH family phosphoesterase [Priestia flexa]|uniref:DHH family phosphoesterase n=1 Tax=Priestia flexa TaxID=86664 RepID=UPI001B324718|nr:bifunctional oligoribonuclease/PAP phosphatase NrnA [Priestia flexa]
MKTQILDAIKSFDTIIIHRHVRPDPDAYGSQCGLSELLKTSFPEKNIYVTGKEAESLKFLYQMDDVADDLYEDALVIVCDTANQERICDQRYAKGKMLIKIDHHPNEDQYGDLLWVDTEASSTSEMIYEFFLHGKEDGLMLNDRGAKLIFSGIVGDTGRFLFPSTKPKTFRYASDLIQYDFEFKNVYDEMYKTKENVAHLHGYVLQNFSLSESGVGYMRIPKEILEKYNVTPADASQLVSSLGHIEGIKVWVFFVEEEDQIRVRLRSKGPVINTIARKYKGGGHPLAAGASIYSWDEVQPLLQDLEALFQ